jgi:protease I
MLLQAGQVAQKIEFQAASLGLGTASFVSFDTRGVTQLCRLPKAHEPILLICVGHSSKSPEMKTEDIKEKVPSVKRAVFIIASENYRDEEFFETRSVLNRAGIETEVASSRLGVVRGMFGGMTESTVLINRLRVDSYDAIVLIGGLGAIEYFGNPLMYDIIREAANKGKVLAAISVAPRILAEAGVLGGVKATSSLSERRILEIGGARFSEVLVEKDGRIITASESGVAQLFGEAIADTLLIVQ